MTRSLIALAAAALAVGGCSTLDNMMDTGAVPMDMTPENRAGYVQMAAASDMFEIQSSQIALTRAQHPAVRQFAQMMIDHHSQTTRQLMAAAQASGVAPTPSLMPMQAQMIANLQQPSGASFDRMYMMQQVQAHQMALALHSNYARDGDTPALRATASAAVPIITQHLARARQID